MNKILNKIKKLIPKKVFKALQPVYHFLMSWFSAFVFCYPSNELIVIGVTGTTGKTTSIGLIAKMLEEAGHKVGYTSTAMFNDGEKEWLNDKKMTMIGRFFTQRILRRMVKNNCQYAIIETTSEGIVQFRHKFINYDVVLITGLYPEHIDSHGSFENYKKVKGKLFAHLKKCSYKYTDEKNNVIKTLSGIKKIELNKVKKTIVVNGNDEHKDYFLDFWAEEKIMFLNPESLEEITENNNKIKVLKYRDINVSSEGTSFKVENNIINLKMLGYFNVKNAMTAVCVGISQNIDYQIIKKGLEKIEGVPGRLEKIDEGQDFSVIVDYAFEPEALSKLYETVDLLPHNKIIHVLGATGGGRDIARRPKLGEIAGKNADIVIVTNEDPYDDDPEIIIDQVALGAEKSGKKENKNLFKINDRREAINKAIFLAEESDLVLITGKGSEQAICVANGEKITWDDRAVARSLINEKQEKKYVDKKNQE